MDLKKRTLQNVIQHAQHMMLTHVGQEEPRDQQTTLSPWSKPQSLEEFLQSSSYMAYSLSALRRDVMENKDTRFLQWLSITVETLNSVFSLDPSVKEIGLRHIRSQIHYIQFLPSTYQDWFMHAIEQCTQFKWKNNRSMQCWIDERINEKMYVTKHTKEQAITRAYKAYVEYAANYTNTQNDGDNRYKTMANEKLYNAVKCITTLAQYPDTKEIQMGLYLDIYKRYQSIPSEFILNAPSRHTVDQSFPIKIVLEYIKHQGWDFKNPPDHPYSFLHLNVLDCTNYSLYEELFKNNQIEWNSTQNRLQIDIGASALELNSYVEGYTTESQDFSATFQQDHC